VVNQKEDRLSIIQPRTIIVLLIIAGLFPRQGHAAVDLAADAVGVVTGLLNGQGINIEQRSVETVAMLAAILVVISILSSSVVRAQRKGR